MYTQESNHMQDTDFCERRPELLQEATGQLTRSIALHKCSVASGSNQEAFHKILCPDEPSELVTRHKCIHMCRWVMRATH